MQERRFVSGLDIGTTKVCAIIAEERSPGELEIVGVGTSPSTGLRKGIIIDLDKTVQAIQVAVQRAEHMAGVRMDQVFVCVAGGHIAALNSNGVVAVTRPDKEITDLDVERAIEAAKAVTIPSEREILHVLPRDFMVDGCPGIKDPVGMAGLRLEVSVHIVTGSVTALQNVVKCVQRAGLDVADVVIQPLAAGEAVLTDEEKDLGAILVDIGGGTTDLAVFHEGSVWHTAVIPVGGNHITSDLAFGLRVPLARAEELKVQSGHALAEKLDTRLLVASAAVMDGGSGGPMSARPGDSDRQTMSSIIRPRVEEIFQLVRQEVDRAQHPSLVPSGVVITGGTGLLGGVAEVATQILDLPVRIGVPERVGGLVDVVKSPIYATAVGLVLYGSRWGGGRSAESRRERFDLFKGLVARVRNWFLDLFPS
ncbi:MAG: cell division protein FtsA [Firmicutes bacterium]|nr:cell division protein FtsA [Bacillota bacterium]